MGGGSADPNLVHAQNWYTQPNHFAVYANQPEILRILLDAGAEPGRSRFMDSGWQKLLDRAEEMGFQDCHDVLCNVLRERFGFNPEFARLGEAIRSRERPRVESVLAEQPDLAKACDPSGNNAVHWAVMTRQPELFGLLADLGAELDHCRSDGQTPAHVLANGDYAYRTRRELKGLKYPDEATVLRALLDAGASCDLSIACASGDRSRVENLLQRDPGAARRLDSGRRSPLMYAARSGRLEVVRTLLKHGADPNKPEELADSGAALFEACCRGHREVAELLLEHGANPNAGSDSSGDCVHIAKCWAGERAEPIVALLRRHGATNPAWNMKVEEMSQAIRDDDPISGEFEFALEALARNDLDLATQLLGKYPKLADQLHGGCLRMGSPDVAITEGTILKLLLQAGFDPNRPDWLGKTALHHFAGRGEVGNALLMIEHGADIDAVDDEFHATPLAWAAREGHLETARLLLEHGADANLPLDIPQATPLARARAGRHGEVVALLEGRDV